MDPAEQSGPDSGPQDVNPVFLQQLRELDIPEEAAKQVGLHYVHTGARSLSETDSFCMYMESCPWENAA